MAHRIWKSRSGRETRHILAENREDGVLRTLCGSAIPSDAKTRGKAADGDCDFCKQIQAIQAAKAKLKEETASA